MLNGIFFIVTKFVKSLLLLVVLNGLVPASAWSATFSLAGAANAAKARNTNPTRSYTSDAKFGFGAALLIEGQPLATNGVFTTEFGLVYAPRNTGYGTFYTEKTTWVELPLLERIHILGFSLGVGGYLAKATGDIKRTYATGATTYTYDDVQRATIDYGAAFAVGYEFKLIGAKLFADARYNYGLRNLSTAQNLEYKYTDLQLLLGVRF